MTRTKVKGTKFKAASSPEQEPDFSKMASVIISPINSDEESSNTPTLSREYNVMNNSVFVPQVMPSYRDLNQGSFVALSYSEPPNQYYSLPVAQNFVTCAPSTTYSNGLNVSVDEADRILDEAVDELFLNEEGSYDNLNDFVHDWDPEFDDIDSVGPSVDDDAQLGYLLEKLLG